MLTRSLKCALLLAITTTVSACGGVGSVGGAAVGPRFGEIQPKKNFFLRPGGPDKDPSSYLGRFIPPGTTDAAVDDAEAMQTQCSQYFQKKVVPAGGFA